MANILTKFIPDLQMALDEVSRELVGFIPSVARNSAAERAALNESIIVPVSTAIAAGDVAPAMAVPEPGDFAPDYEEIKITKSRNAGFGLTGEEYRGLDNGLGANYFVAENFKQAVRTLCNEVEADVARAAALGSSRAYGTAGTTPFGSDLSATAELHKILGDNGAPVADRSLIIDTTAGVNLRKLTQLTNVGAAGTSMTLRDGELLPLHGFSIKESAYVAKPEIGDATTLTVAAAGVGATEIEIGSIASGALKVGDIITFAGDPNQYVVASVPASFTAGAKFKIAKPGLRKAVEASSAVTVVASAVRNVGFCRNAIQLVTRAPALPGGSDAAVDSTMLTDARSGLSFEVRVYQGYRKMRAEVALAWGVKAIKPEHIATLLG